MIGPEPQVTVQGVLDAQVCVPEGWTNEQALTYVNLAYPCGTAGGWILRTDDKLLCGVPVRRPCDERKGCVHIMFDA